MSIVSCRAFLGSGQANMAAIIMWLRGYHAGKRGVIDVIDQPPTDPYGGRLGHYCKEHLGESVIDASRADTVGARSRHLIMITSLVARRDAAEQGRDRHPVCYAL
jgi:hypothetical protein